MKKFTILAAIAILATGIQGKAQCDLETEIDEFNLITTRDMRWQPVERNLKGGLLEIKIKQRCQEPDTVWALFIKAFPPGFRCLDATSHLILKASEGQLLISLPIQTDHECYSAGEVLVQYVLLEADALEFLETTSIGAVRLEYTNGIQDWHPKNPDIFKTAINCFK